jgi:hypothetical protein
VSDHQTNLLRWVWISAGDIVEEALLWASYPSPAS